jgi:hypothetical protein
VLAWISTGIPPGSPYSSTARPRPSAVWMVRSNPAPEACAQPAPALMTDTGPVPFSGHPPGPAGGIWPCPAHDRCGHPVKCRDVRHQKESCSSQRRGPDAEDHQRQPRGHRPGCSCRKRAAARQRAMKQVTARRLFKISTASAGVGVTLLVPIWATTEYHNAGGWPARDSASVREPTGCGISGSSTRSSRTR